MRSILLSYSTVVSYFLILSILIIVKAENKRKIVQIPGDLVLGGLFPMHEQVGKKMSFI